MFIRIIIFSQFILELIQLKVILSLKIWTCKIILSWKFSEIETIENQFSSRITKIWTINISI